jgi:hypothetical protein
MELEPVDCEINRPGIDLDTKKDPAACDTNDGSISVTGSAGRLPYQFNINGGAYQPSGSFNHLGGGTFTVGIRDANGCTNTTEVSLFIASSDLAATVHTEEDNECLNNNGSITVTATGSHRPFEYKLGTGSFSADSTFTNLKNGLYTITVKDALDCSLSIGVTVSRGQTGVSWSNEVRSIIEANCAVSGCHVSGNQIPNFSVFSTVKSNASDIKSRTGSRSMPPDGKSISQEEINKIACWVEDGAKDN